MTNDFIDDACEALDKSGQPYVFLVGDGPVTKIFSNLTEEDRAMLEEWVDNGHVLELFRTILDKYS
jgi:hypothetical protein